MLHFPQTFPLLSQHTTSHTKYLHGSLCSYCVIVFAAVGQLSTNSLLPAKGKWVTTRKERPSNHLPRFSNSEQISLLPLPHFILPRRVVDSRSILLPCLIQRFSLHNNFSNPRFAPLWHNLSSEISSRPTLLLGQYESTKYSDSAL
jgi:hypothetical protein